MKKVVIGFAFFLLGILFLTSILSPFAFDACNHFFPNTFPFRRVFNRMLMISALLMLYPLAVYWKINSLEKLGLKDKNWLKKWLGGLLLGTIIMLTLSACFLLPYSYSLQITFSKTAQILIGAILIGFFEEILFRGLFFYALKNFAAKWLIPLAIFSSAFFAKVHFIKAQNPATPIHWLSGWEMWSHVWPPLHQIPSMYPHILNLFLVGLVLCAITWRTQSLWSAMGLHTGWVTIIMFSSKLQITPPLPLHDYLVKSLPITLTLILILCIIFKNTAPKKLTRA